MRKYKVLVITVMTALSLSGCAGGLLPGSSSGQETGEQVNESGSAEQESQGGKGIWDRENRDAVSSSLENALNEEEEKKLYNAYIEVNNFMVSRLQDSLDRYFDKVAFQKDFAPSDLDYDCLTMLNSQFENLEKAITLAEKKSERNSLDEAFLAMYPSLNTLMTTLNEIEEYTEARAYLKDNYAKGAEYHSALWSALTEYEETSVVFETLLGETAAERNAVQLERMKEEGLLAFYAINMALSSAQAIDEELYRQEITNDNIIEMDLEAIKPLFEEFCGYVDEVLAYSEDGEQLRTEGISTKTVNWYLFINSMEDTRKSITSLIRHAEEQRPLSQTDTMINFVGNSSVESFELGISDMIDNYNRVISE